jgi:acyl-CoA reductase-like NAD-dependent aldehyde dehydrogenase
MKIDNVDKRNIGTVTTRWSSKNPQDQFTVENPATGEPIAIVQGGGVDEVDRAVRAAHEGFLKWRLRPPRERGSILLKVAEKIRAHADEIAHLETREMGKPFTQSRPYDVEVCINSFDYFGNLIAKMPAGTVHDLGALSSTTYIEPYGVVGGILPFNWPPIHFAAKTAPALAAGNAIVLKPGEQAPLAVIRLVELVNEVVPDDVVHVVPGLGPVGGALVSHKLVRKISFTGSPDTGRRVMQSVAQNLTPALLELGGKNPFVVFADADVAHLTSDIIEGAYYNQGEACTAASRVLVHRTIHDRVVASLAKAVSKLCVGDGEDPRTHIGPLINANQKARVLKYMQIAREEGAKIAAEAPLPTDPRLKNGHFVAPTLYVGVRPEMRIAQEEIFGPVTCVIPFDTYDEAIAIANGTEFGLVACVYTRDAELANRASRDIEAGVVFINNYNRAFLGSPFGGTKASGYGREHSIETLREFGYLKAVRAPTGRSPVPRWAAGADVTAD